MSKQDKSKHPYQHIKDELRAIEKEASFRAHNLAYIRVDERFESETLIPDGIKILANKILDLRRMYEKLKDVEIIETKPVLVTDLGGDTIKQYYRDTKFYVGPNTMRELEEMEWPQARME